MSNDRLRLIWVGDEARLGAIEAALTAGEAELRATQNPGGLDALLEDGPSAVLADVGQLKDVAAKLEGSNTPLLALGQDESRDAVESAAAAGARDYFTDSTLARLSSALCREVGVAELRESNWFLNATIDAIPHVVFVKDAEHLRTRLANQAYANLSGASKEDLIGKTDRELHPEQFVDEWEKMDRQVLENQEAIRFQEPFKDTESGRMLWFGTTKVALVDEDGKSQYLLGITEDVTELLESKNDLEKAKSQLLKTLQQVSETEDAAVVGELSADISRELRASASGTLSWLEDQLGRKLSEVEVKDALENAVRELKALVGGLARIQSHQQDRGEPEATKVLDLVSEASKRVSEEFGEDVAIQVVDDEPVEANCNHEEIVSALANAMAYFVDEDGEAEIVVRVRTEAGAPAVEVTAESETLRPAELAQIFMPRKVSGTDIEGLRKQIRLALARRVIQRNAGSLTAISADGSGTTLHVGLCPVS